MNLRVMTSPAADWQVMMTPLPSESRSDVSTLTSAFPWASASVMMSGPGLKSTIILRFGRHRAWRVSVDPTTSEPMWVEGMVSVASLAKSPVTCRPVLVEAVKVKLKSAMVGVTVRCLSTVPPGELRSSYVTAWPACVSPNTWSSAGATAIQSKVSSTRKLSPAPLV